MKRLSIMAAILALVFASCASVPESKAYDEGAMGAAETESAASAVEPSITVQDQAIKNSSILVSSVYFNANGWLVIHKAVEGKPGPVVGWIQVRPGLNTDLRIQLSDASAPAYFAMLHIDAGLMYIYEFPGPDLPFKVGDAILMRQFSILR